MDINGIISAERVINSFKNYFKRSEINLKEIAELQDEFELEYAMSQIFSMKQKEIFLKKVKGEKLTKTEREYYSRSIKKKVLALANPDLHRLASKLCPSLKGFYNLFIFWTMVQSGLEQAVG